MKNSRKFKYFKNVIKKDGYKDIALQPIHIPLDDIDQLKRVFTLLESLTCGIDNPDIYLCLVHY